MTAKPLVFESITEFKKYRCKVSPDKNIGFVPTMGALHEGHASLLRRSASENDETLLSIFVNPTQFNNSSDLKNYPRTWDADLKIAAECGVSAIFIPTFEQIYPDNYRFKITESESSKILCGATRPGHFDGVLTIVMKLLQIISAHTAYFGEKDFQQYQLIKDLAESFFLPTKIVGCPTLRESSGLAMSSRNIKLSNPSREKAALIYKLLSTKNSGVSIREELTTNGFEVDYVEDHFGRRFVAAFLEGVRLIDNVEIK